MTIGEALTTAREHAGLSVADVSERTRIRPYLIEAIENNQFAVCGGDVYARGHIRTLASTLGVEAEPLLVQYDNQRPHPAPTTIKEVFTAGRGRVEPRTWNWSAVMAGVLVVAVAYGGFRLASATDHRTPQRLSSSIATTVPDQGSEAASGGNSAGQGAPGQGAQGQGSQGQGAQGQGAQPGAAPGGSSEPETASKPGKQVEVKVAATNDQAWLSVTGNNGKQLFRGTLPEGKSKKFTDSKMVTLVVGNAAAVKVTVNGKDMGSLGKRGEVVRLIYRPGDPDSSG